MAARMKSVRFGIETFLHQQVDMAEVNEAEIDRNLLTILRPKFLDFSHIVHPCTIH